NSRSIELGERGLNEAFTPRAAKRKLFVKRLPAYPHFGQYRICVVVEGLKPGPGRELQRVEERYLPFGTENWNKRFRIQRVFFASDFDRELLPNTGVVFIAVFVVRIFSQSFPNKDAAKGESDTACGQIK